MLTDIKDNSNSLAILAAEKIKEQILNGSLTAGEKIPNETELQQQLNVSRSVVREAIKILVAKNVLTIERGKGTFVAQHPGMVDDPFGFSFEQDREKLGRNLVEFRAQVEPLAAYLAAKNITDSEIVDLREKLEKLINAFRSNSDSLQYDIDLHSTIAKCSGNIVFKKLIPIIIYGIQEVNPKIFSFYGIKKTIELSCAEHIAVVEAICNHDCEAAKAAMERQLVNISIAVKDGEK